MYSELLLRPTALQGQRIYPLDARRLVAKATDGKGVSEAFFGRQVKRLAGKENDGRFSMIPVIFDGGNGFIRIFGIGREGSDLLTEEMGKIVKSVASSLNCAVPVELRQGHHLRKNADRIVPYHIAKLALSKTGKNGNATMRKRYETFREAGNDIKKLEPMIKEIITNGIVQFAEDIDSEQADPSRITDNIPHDLVIKIHEGTPSISRIHPDSPGHAVIIRNLKFSMLGDLYGPWSVGHLRSHGCGLIKKLAGDRDRG